RSRPTRTRNTSPREAAVKLQDSAAYRQWPIECALLLPVVGLQRRRAAAVPLAPSVPFVRRTGRTERPCGPVGQPIRREVNSSARIAAIVMPAPCFARAGPARLSIPAMRPRGSFGRRATDIVGRDWRARHAVSDAAGGARMTVVDSHAHIWGEGFVPPAFFEKAARGWAAKSPDRRPEMIMPKLLGGLVDPDGDDFVANMDRAGVDMTMVMMIDVGAPVFGQEPATPVEEQIEFYAGLQRRHRERLRCHVSVDIRRPGHLDLIRRAIVDLGLAGVGEITPDGFSVADEAARPMMKLAADLGVPVQVHTRAGVWT